jgi:hypothetical protein
MPPGINDAITSTLVFVGALHHPKIASTVIAIINKSVKSLSLTLQKDLLLSKLLLVWALLASDFLCRVVLVWVCINRLNILNGSSLTDCGTAQERCNNK